MHWREVFFGLVCYFFVEYAGLILNRFLILFFAFLILIKKIDWGVVGGEMGTILFIIKKNWLKKNILKMKLRCIEQWWTVVWLSWFRSILRDGGRVEKQLKLSFVGDSEWRVRVILSLFLSRLFFFFNFWHFLSSSLSSNDRISSILSSLPSLFFYNEK